MKAARFVASGVLALTCLAGFHGVAMAAEPLDDEALSNAYAGDGTEQMGIPNSPFLSLFNAMAMAGNKSAKMLNKEEFVQALAASGVTTPLPTEVYNGQPVTEVVLPSKPMSATIKLSQLISNMTGVKYDAPGLGTITIKNMDAGGTRLWVWNH